MKTMRNEESLLKQIHKHFPEKVKNNEKIKECSTYPPLTLAYLGDAVYEIVIRTLVVEGNRGAVKSLHRHTSGLVNARAQAAIAHAIMDELTAEELSIYKRGRNAKSNTSAKNASIHDYRIATGLEALMGYLYLNGDMDRCLELIQLGLSAIRTGQK